MDRRKGSGKAWLSVAQHENVSLNADDLIALYDGNIAEMTRRLKLSPPVPKGLARFAKDRDNARFSGRKQIKPVIVIAEALGLGLKGMTTRWDEKALVRIVSAVDPNFKPPKSPVAKSPPTEGPQQPGDPFAKYRGSAPTLSEDDRETERDVHAAKARILDLDWDQSGCLIMRDALDVRMDALANKIPSKSESELMLSYRFDRLLLERPTEFYVAMGDEAYWFVKHRAQLRLKDGIVMIPSSMADQVNYPDSHRLYGGGSKDRAMDPNRPRVGRFSVSLDVLNQMGLDPAVDMFYQLRIFILDTDRALADSHGRIDYLGQSEHFDEVAGPKPESGDIPWYDIKATRREGVAGEKDTYTFKAERRTRPDCQE